jgi:hypothetical protein
VYVREGVPKESKQTKEMPTLIGNLTDVNLSMLVERERGDYVLYKMERKK